AHADPSSLISAGAEPARCSQTREPRQTPRPTDQQRSASDIQHQNSCLAEKESAQCPETMRSEETLFPAYWWGTAIDDVAERPNVATYGRYGFEPLPPLPFQMLGEFDWLINRASHMSHIGQEKAAMNRVSLTALRECSAKLGLKLPEPFVKFVDSPTLHEKVRSTTDCFLDVCPELIPSPLGQGYLARFLADSQGCVFWYLFLTPVGSDHAVVSSPGFYGTAAEEWQEEKPDASEIVFCEESFEAFMCRFWLENEICFSQFNSTPLLEVGRTYLQQYRNRP
ncbi:MAG TPA: hypothetical protein VNU68_07145, partial [Verrucomicrobiae bacterium]|nr:hypothetical protein [Verrucomicrobiae bacterium]